MTLLWGGGILPCEQPVARVFLCRSGDTWVIGTLGDCDVFVWVCAWEWTCRITLSTGVCRRVTELGHAGTLTPDSGLQNGEK